MSVIILAGALVDGIRNLQLLYCRGRTIILTWHRPMTDFEYTILGRDERERNEKDQMPWLT